MTAPKDAAHARRAARAAAKPPKERTRSREALNRAGHTAWQVALGISAAKWLEANVDLADVVGADVLEEVCGGAVAYASAWLKNFVRRNRAVLPEFIEELAEEHL